MLIELLPEIFNIVFTYCETTSRNTLWRTSKQLRILIKSNCNLKDMLFNPDDIYSAVYNHGITYFQWLVDIYIYTAPYKGQWEIFDRLSRLVGMYGTHEQIKYIADNYDTDEITMLRYGLVLNNRLKEEDYIVNNYITDPCERCIYYISLIKILWLLNAGDLNTNINILDYYIKNRYLYAILPYLYFTEIPTNIILDYIKKKYKIIYPKIIELIDNNNIKCGKNTESYFIFNFPYKYSLLHKNINIHKNMNNKTLNRNCSVMIKYSDFTVDELVEIIKHKCIKCFILNSDYTDCHCKYLYFTYEILKKNIVIDYISNDPLSVLKYCTSLNINVTIHLLEAIYETLSEQYSSCIQLNFKKNFLEHINNLIDIILYYDIKIKCDILWRMFEKNIDFNIEIINLLKNVKISQCERYCPCSYKYVYFINNIDNNKIFIIYQFLKDKGLLNKNITILIDDTNKIMNFNTHYLSLNDDIIVCTEDIIGKFINKWYNLSGNYLTPTLKFLNENSINKKYCLEIKYPLLNLY